MHACISGPLGPAMSLLSTLGLAGQRGETPIRPSWDEVVVLSQLPPDIAKSNAYASQSCSQSRSPIPGSSTPRAMLGAMLG